MASSAIVLMYGVTVMLWISTAETCTTHSSYRPLPSVACARITVLPAPTALTLPLPSTVATAGLVLVHSSSWLLAVLGVSVGVSLAV